MSARVVVVDYGIGNVFSVCNALQAIGAEPVLSRKPADIKSADRLILPGVGAFARAMEALKAFGLDGMIADYVKTGKPFMGICIGMQVLMQRSTEFGDTEGLGYFEGRVDRLPSTNSTGKHVRVPHIGWSSLKPQQSFEATPLAKIDNGAVYFVHSYHCLPANPDHMLAIADYDGVAVTAAIRRDNIVGMQFHPERSGIIGQRVLENFVRMG